MFVPLLRPIKRNQFSILGEKRSNGTLALEVCQFIMIGQADLLSGHAGVADVGHTSVVREELLQVQGKLAGFESCVEGGGDSEWKSHLSKRLLLLINLNSYKF